MIGSAHTSSEQSEKDWALARFERASSVEAGLLVKVVLSQLGPEPLHHLAVEIQRRLGVRGQERKILRVADFLLELLLDFGKQLGGGEQIEHARCQYFRSGDLAFVGDRADGCDRGLPVVIVHSRDTRRKVQFS